MANGISRRDALRGLAAGAALTAAGGGLSAAQRIDEQGVAEEGLAGVRTGQSFRHSVCRWCFRDMPLDELAVAARNLGLASIELVGPDDAPILKQFGLTCAMSNGVTTIPNGLNRIEHHEEQVPGTIRRIEECAQVGYPAVIVFSGDRRGMSDREGLENCARALREIVPAAERDGVTVCMELLSSRINHPDHMCDRTVWGVELVERVGSDRFKLLYDIYHMQIMEGDVIRTIQTYHQHIGHYHTAGNPGRHEFAPGDPQELNYRAIMEAIHESGFRGFVGQEFIPTRDPMTSLREAVQICSVS